MSRQYLKQLQSRAQKLLQVSDDEQDEEEINAYTATNRRTLSPRGNSDNFIHDQQASTYEIEADDERYAGTDVELLKKCLHLTNENGSLRQRLENKEMENQELRKQIAIKNQTQRQLRSIIDQKIEIGRQIAEEKSAKQYGSLQKERELIQAQKELIKKQYAQIQKDRLLLSREADQLTELRTRVQLKQSSQTAQPRHAASEQEHRLKFRYEQAQQRSRRLQILLREQRGKMLRMCEFINKELPQLKDVLAQMTTKLQVKVDRYLLKNIYY